MSVLSTMLGALDQFDREGDASGARTHLAIAKDVHKPWGSERWLVPEGSPFGFKIITINAGKRTSLQYHRSKEEANLVLDGQGRLFVGRVDAPLAEYALIVGEIVHVVPGIVHRIEAVTDLVLVEVSTPELGRVPWIFAAGSCRSVRCLIS
jgi:mannose-6-phosphate isomerase